MQPKIYIIIPTYNEKDNIKKLIEKIFNLNISDLNILIIDDNSPDGTGQKVKKLIEKYKNHLHLIQRPKKMGIGSAYIFGFKYAIEHGADLIFEMDADFSHDPKYIPDFVEQMQKNFDVVLGSRRIKNGNIIGWNWTRKLMSSGAMLFAKIILKLKTKDVTTGYRCYTREALLKINLDEIKSNGYAFQEEMIYLCEKKHFKIKEIPIIFEDRKFGKSKLNSKDVLEFFKTVIKLRSKEKNKNSKKIFLLLIISIFLIFLIFFKMQSKNSYCELSEFKNNLPISEYIAHAGGGYNGLTYTNSLESLNYNYSQKKYKFFEVDISKTIDEKLVMVHDWDNTFKKYFSTSTTKIPNYEEFMNLKMNYGLTQIDLVQLLDWLSDKPDAYLVTDVKGDNISALKKISSNYPNYLNQIIPQIYSFSEYEKLKTLGYNNIILTLYRLNASDNQIIEFVKNKKILAVTMPKEKAKNNLPKLLLKEGVPSFVHTINTTKEKNKFKKNCVFGFYTDYLHN